MIGKDKIVDDSQTIRCWCAGVLIAAEAFAVMKTALSQSEIDALLEAAQALSNHARAHTRLGRPHTLRRSSRQTSPAPETAKLESPKLASAKSTSAKFESAKSETASLEAMLEELQRENAQLKLLLAQMKAQEAKQRA